MLIICDTSARTYFPLWSITSPGVVQYSGGIFFPASPADVYLVLNNKIQDTTVMSPSTGIGIEADVRILVTPR